MEPYQYMGRDFPRGECDRLKQVRGVEYQNNRTFFESADDDDSMNFGKLMFCLGNFPIEDVMF